MKRVRQVTSQIEHADDILLEGDSTESDEETQQKRLKFDNLEYHAGVIQAAFNLEFCGADDKFSGAGLYPGEILELWIFILSELKWATPQS